MENNNKRHEYKCCDCGKIFRDTYCLERHRKRKNPCLNVNITEEDKKTPYCIFCNKIFSTKGNLENHHKICKIKNGGIQILTEKMNEIKKEQENYKKQLEDKNKIIEEQKKLLNDTYVLPTTESDLTNIVKPEKCQWTKLNSYRTPNTDHIDYEDFLAKFKDYGVQIPYIYMEKIYFNPEEAPENLSIYLTNKKTGEMMVFDGENWIFSNKKQIYPEIRRILYDISDDLITKVCSLYLVNEKDEPYIHWYIDMMLHRQETLKCNKNELEQEKIELERLDNIVNTFRDQVKEIAKKKRNTVEKKIKNLESKLNTKYVSLSEKPVLKRLNQF